MKNSPEIPAQTLDSSLRYLYDSIRYFECELMAIEFKYNGVVWRADTPEEAIALRAQLQKSTHFPVDEHEVMDERDRFWTPDKFMDVIDGIGDLQRRLLRIVHDHPRITGKELVVELGINSEVSLAGVISGLSKQLKPLDVALNQVLAIEVKWIGRVKTRRFILDDFFASAGAKQNWPDCAPDGR